MSYLSRSAFAATLLFCLGAFIALALGTLHFETAGGAVGYSTPVAVGFMVLILAWLLVATYRRAGDLGAPLSGRLAAVVGTCFFPPLVTLIVMCVPSATAGRDGQRASRTAGPLKIALALPLGAAIGWGLLLLVQAVFRAL